MIFTDQTGHSFQLTDSPKRIISLVPSQTEYLFDLGLESSIIGITKFCIHPKELCKKVQKIGGTKTLNLELIISLNPDLIIANKEENTKEEIEFLKSKFPVYISDIFNLSDSFKMMEDIGLITHKTEKAEEIINKIKNGFNELNASLINKKVIYLIWKKPYMAAGKNTFINHIISLAGFENIIDGRYPELKIEEIQKANADIIFLSSEPYPFKDKHIEELQAFASKVILVDGELFSWYGSRLQYTPNYLNLLIKNINGKNWN